MARVGILIILGAIAAASVAPPARSARAAEAPCAAFERPVPSLIRRAEVLPGGARVFDLAAGWAELNAPSQGAALPPIQSYRETIAQLVPEFDAHSLLRRQRAHFAAAGFSSHLPRYDAILDGRIGTIRKASCLEQFLLALHLELEPDLFKPTEFAAHVLVSSQGTRVYWVSSATPVVAPHAEANRRIESDLSSGAFRLVSHLHLHPFFLKSLPAADIAATLIPSGDRTMGDVSVYLGLRRTWQLETAQITNGFETIEVPATQFDQL